METLLLMAAGAALVLVLQYMRRATPCGVEMPTTAPRYAVEPDLYRPTCSLTLGHTGLHDWTIPR